MKIILGEWVLILYDWYFCKKKLREIYLEGGWENRKGSYFFFLLVDGLYCS